MFHRIIFPVLIVSSLFRNFLKSQCRSFSVVNEHRMQEYSKCPVYQTRLMIAHNKTIKKLNIINYFLYWSVTLFTVRSKKQQLALQIWRLSKVGTGCPYRWILKLNKNTRLFLNVFAKSPLLPCIIHRADWSHWIVPTSWYFLHENVL